MSTSRLQHHSQSFNTYRPSQSRRGHYSVSAPSSSPPQNRERSQSSHIRFEESDASSSSTSSLAKRQAEWIKAANKPMRNRDSSSTKSTDSSSDLPRRSVSSKKRKWMDDIESNHTSSPFVPDAVSTPVATTKKRDAPVLIPIPVDSHLTDAYIKAVKHQSRKDIRKSIEKKRTFRARAPSSSSSSDNDDNQQPRRDEKRKKRKQSADRKSREPAEREKAERKKSTTDVRQPENKAKGNAEDESKPDASSAQTTKHINAKLETDLFASLTKLLPVQLVSHSRSKLEEEVKQAANAKTDNRNYPPKSSGPSDKAVTLRAVRDLIIRQSATRLAISLEAGGRDQGQSTCVTGSELGSVCIESHLARIAGDRAKRIEILEMEVRGLKMRLNQ